MNKDLAPDQVCSGGTDQKRDTKPWKLVNGIKPFSYDVLDIGDNGLIKGERKLGAVDSQYNKDAFPAKDIAR